MTDDEILDLARQEPELRELAREALKNEMSQRRLKLEPAPAPPPLLNLILRMGSACK